MKKIGYFSCIIFFMFLVGCSNNKKENGNLLNASLFPLILTTIIEKEYLVNPNNEDTKKTSRTEKKVYKNIKIQENKESYEIIGQLDKKTKKIEFKKVDEGKRISDAEGNVYGDFGGK